MIFFASYRKNVIDCKNKLGNNTIYVDWCDSGQLYEPIEKEKLNGMDRMGS